MLRNKFFPTKSGQSVVEYLVFFAAIGAVTLLSVSLLYPSLYEGCRQLYQDAAELDYMHSTEE